MSYEVTHTALPGDGDPVVLTFRGLPVHVNEDDSSAVTVLIPPDDAEALGEALARIPGGTVHALVDELESLRTKLRVLTEDRANLERERGVADEAHREALYAENNEGGVARGVVSDVARILDVNIVSGPGSKWDREHMRRVIDAAKAMSGELENLRTATAEAQKDVDYYKEWAEGNGHRLTETQTALSDAVSDADALRATIVRQANEITALKGESE